jgi:hypothetical protein
MAQGGDEKDDLNQLIPPNAVRKVEVEPEAVAVQRLINEGAKIQHDATNEAAKEAANHDKYMRIVTLCAVLTLGILGFLAYAFIAGGLSEDTKKLIVAAFTAGLTGVIGVAVGKKI